MGSSPTCSGEEIFLPLESKNKITPDPLSREGFQSASTPCWRRSSRAQQHLGWAKFPMGQQEVSGTDGARQHLWKDLRVEFEFHYMSRNFPTDRNTVVGVECWVIAGTRAQLQFWERSRRDREFFFTWEFFTGNFFSRHTLGLGFGKSGPTAGRR